LKQAAEWRILDASGMSEPRVHTDPTITGSVLGSYRILREISSGGMGAVFRAEHVLLGRPAAVKILRPDLTVDDDLVQRFVNEARAVTASKHPGIVEVYDFGYTPDGRAFIVMELLEGESLGHRLAHGRLGEPAAAAIAHGIASALKAAHRVGVIHRDLKPDNVFLVPDPDGGPDRTKVLDFGIAKLADGAPAGTRQTQTGILIGTPLYMAPEQARAAGMIDRRADLYSLGCILYHMLVGRPPFVADGAGEIIALQMFSPPVPPSRLAPVSPRMEQLVLRLLDKDPDARFDTAAELATALAGFDTQLAHRASRPSDQGALLAMSASMPALPPITREPLAAAIAPPARAPRPVVAGAIAIAVLGGALGYAMLRGGDAPPAAVAAPSPSSPVTPATPSSPPGPAPAAPGPAPAAPASRSAALPASASPAVDEATSARTTPRLPHPRDSLGHRAVPGHRSAAPGDRPGPAISGPLAHPGDLGVPDKAIEVIRDIRQPEPPPTGPHTAAGSPFENSIDLDHKPRKDPAAP
jgi:eukaryotic-like serine/threonine-protein kinase